ncbi:MAG: glycine betaine/L-proline ABC transporter ATP-binding protein [Victivallales bacterium]|nr:glycine betaine/L-proline ABC transporter ATP-binding protein [Victivallales bacterium]
MPKIVVKNIEKIFGNQIDKARSMFEQDISKNEILEKTGCAIGVFDASFEVYEGEKLVIMGLSGSGKSTLVRCINRLHEPTRGTVTVDGVNVRELSNEELCTFRQQKFGMVFQHFALLPHRTILENAAFGLELQKIDRDERYRKAEKALQVVKLEGWENVYPEQLSGGMQQRVGLARALAVDTDILLMDEAFSALDPLIRAEMQDELLQIEELKKKAVVFITHDLDEALKIGDRIILMKDGKIVQTGTPKDILKKPATRYVERFVEKVDMSKIVTAEDAMVPVGTVVYPGEEPKNILEKMDKNNVSYLPVVDKKGMLRGIVARDDIKNKIKGKRDKSIIIKPDSYVFAPETPLKSMLSSIAVLDSPAVVVNKSGIIKGTISEKSIVAALADAENKKYLEKHATH